MGEVRVGGAGGDIGGGNAHRPLHSVIFHVSRASGFIHR